LSVDSIISQKYPLSDAFDQKKLAYRTNII